MLRRTFSRFCATVERLVEEFDVLVVGGGPAGLSAAIRLKQLNQIRNTKYNRNEDIRVGLVEKGSQIGAHTLSGACIETISLDELIPDWRQKNDNKIKNNEDNKIILSPVTHDLFYYLPDSERAWKAPFLPPTLNNHKKKNIIISLGSLTKFLAEEAEALGVEIYPGFAAADVVVNKNNTNNIYLEGVQLHDMGIGKDNKKKSDYDPGMIFKAKQVIFAEGCRGSCTKKLEEIFSLRKKKTNKYINSSVEREVHQTYGLGIKEVWDNSPSDGKDKKNNTDPYAANGLVMHTVGWPTNDKGHHNTYGGSFLYYYNDLISCGYVVGLDYKNVNIRPYMEFQKWKTHKKIRNHFLLSPGTGKGDQSNNYKGKRILYYGARTLVEGGLNSLPTLFFKGGLLIGDAAGFLNISKIKGTHTAMKSGMLAAEAIFIDLFDNPSHTIQASKSENKTNTTNKHDDAAGYGVACQSYDDLFHNSWLYKELYEVRNVRQNFESNFYWGMLYTGISTTLTKGKEPFDLYVTKKDNEYLKKKDECLPIEYPKPDNVITFDLLTNHSRSGTSHNPDQPVHLKLKDKNIPENVNLKDYDGPEGKYCPAQVYEYVNNKLVINAQNCLHCKACDIKDPTQNIDWTVPEGGGGPNYQGLM